MDYCPLGRTGKVSPGVTPVELAVAFVLTHPAVSSAIIGPRTMEQLELVPPGTDVVP